MLAAGLARDFLNEDAIRVAAEQQMGRKPMADFLSQDNDNED